MSTSFNKRQVYNKTLCHLLRELVDKYPDMRFSQILSNFDFVVKKLVHYEGNDSGEEHTWKDEYYLEPWELEQRVTETLKKLENK